MMKNIQTMADEREGAASVSSTTDTDRIAQLEWMLAEVLGEHVRGQQAYTSRLALMAKWEREGK